MKKQKYRSIPIKELDKLKRWPAGILLLLGLVLLTGCTNSSMVPVDRLWASVQGGRIEAAHAGEEFYFTVPVDENFRELTAMPIHIRLSGEANSGSIRFELRNPDGQPVWNSGTIGPGDFDITATYKPEQSGEYKLGLVYTDKTVAHYDLSWHALRLTPAVFVPGAGMVLVSFGFLLYLAKNHPGWRSLALGALFWVITVALKFGFALMVNPLVFRALDVSTQALFSLANLITYFYIGALTGIFEAGGTYLILLKSRFKNANWNQALAFGIGFGVMEALLLGLGSLGSAGVGYFAPDSMPVVTLGVLARSNHLLYGLAPVAERLFVVFAHVFASVLVFYAIAKGETKYAWLSVLYKTILDAPAGFAAYWGVETLTKLWSIEAVIAVSGLIGLWGTGRIARLYPQGVPAGSEVEAVQG